MKCQDCGSEITQYRVVGVYDQSIFSPEMLEHGRTSTYFYVGGTFIPLAMTLCPACGHVDLWDLKAPAIKGLTLDNTKREVYKKEVSDDG
jgi:uncharacterized Zn finger protein